MFKKFKNKMLKKVLLVLVAFVFSAMLLGSFFHYHSHSTVHHNGFPVKNGCSVCSFIQLMDSSSFELTVFISIFIAIISRLASVKVFLNPVNHSFIYFSHAPPK